MKKTLPFCLVISMLSPVVAHSKDRDITIEPAKMNEVVTNTMWSDTPIEVAVKEWNVTEEEWIRYKSVMQGRAKLYAGAMPPPMVLAMFADSEEERARFAEKMVQFERDKADRLLAAQRAYDDAYRRMYPNEKMFDFDLLREKGLINSGSKTTSSSILPESDEHVPKLGDKVVVFASADCTDICFGKIRTILDKYTIEMEVLFLGTDEEFKGWYEKSKIDKKWIDAKKVSFARDQGQAENLKASPGMGFIVRGKELYEIRV